MTVQATRLMRTVAILALAGAAGCVHASMHVRREHTPGPPIRVRASIVRSDAAEAARVRRAFQRAWQGYRKYAWGHDELRPLSRGVRDWYGEPLLMTPVDAYDTMLLMGLGEEAASAKGLILQRLSFDRDTSVQVFEVTIRLLGGLLSAYQMDGDTAFLRLATDLGTRLLPAFDSPTGMPYRFVNLLTGAVSGPVSNPAEIGTLMLELGTLSKLTGRAVYYDRAKRAVTELYARRSAIGLVGSTIDVRTGEWKDSDSHVSGGIDSYYEYLLKSWRLFGDEDFRRMWEASIEPVNRYLADERFTADTARGRHGDAASRPGSGAGPPPALWYGHADMNTGARRATQFGALDAFLPAVLALSGDTVRAGRLMLSVHRMWTAFGLEPEVMDYSTMTVVEGGYPLRPESIESAYYLFRITGDTVYRSMGRDMFERIERRARTPAGYASIRDVRTGEKRDEMPSFLLAETFKYAYLIFAPPSTLDLNAVVFNTEAHPLRRSW
jgi:mannosidase alpha-like ER degradation enhancer 2